MPNILDELDYQPDRTADYGLRMYIIMGQMVSPDFLGCFWSDPFITFK